MYPSHGAPMAPPQKPETFMLSNEAQQSLPQDAQVALQQVDNCKLIPYLHSLRRFCTLAQRTVARIRSLLPILFEDVC